MLVAMKLPLTIKQLVDQYKVILNALFIQLPEVASSNAYQPIAEFEYERSIDIAFCYTGDVQVQVADMKEGRAA